MSDGSNPKRTNVAASPFRLGYGCKPVASLPQASLCPSRLTTVIDRTPYLRVKDHSLGRVVTLYPTFWCKGGGAPSAVLDSSLSHATLTRQGGRDTDSKRNSSAYDNRLRDAGRRSVSAYLCRSNGVVAVIP